MKKMNYLSLSTVAKNNRSLPFYLRESIPEKQHVKYQNSEKSSSQQAKRDMSTADI